MACRSRFTKNPSNGSWANSSVSNASAAFASRCELHARRGMFLDGMGDPGQYHPSPHLNLAAAASAERSFNRSCSAGAAPRLPS